VVRIKGEVEFIGSFLGEENKKCQKQSEIANSTAPWRFNTKPTRFVERKHNLCRLLVSLKDRSTPYELAVIIGRNT
jgi:hypothetical protein